MATRTPGDGVPTIGTVAAEAGVSRATVSRAFSQPHRLRPETVERVLEVARRLGYAVNPMAKALSTGRSGNLALVVPDIANPFFPPMIRAVERRADQAGYAVFLGHTDEDPAREDLLLTRFAKQVDGFVIASSRMTEADIRAHAERHPVVLINRDVSRIARVLIDTTQGVTQAVEHLAELGHRQIAYLGGPGRSWSNGERRRTVKRVGQKAGLSVAMVPARRSSYELGREAVPAILATGVTAVIAFDDLLAHGVLTGLAERGIDVPGSSASSGATTCSRRRRIRRSRPSRPARPRLVRQRWRCWQAASVVTWPAWTTGFCWTPRWSSGPPPPLHSRNRLHWPAMS